MAGRNSMKTFDREASGEAIATAWEPKTKKIIIVVDLLNRSGEALDFAVELAQHCQADLCIMYVYSGLPRVSGASLIYAVPSIDWERYLLSVDLYKLVDRIRERYPRTFGYFTDNDCPAEAIQSVASKFDADMIIVSAHEKGWAAKLLLYSDVDDFARRSTTPVLVYRSKSKAG
jgi:nucleotide-binding universal stress UspA family protein